MTCQPFCLENPKYMDEHIYMQGLLIGAVECCLLLSRTESDNWIHHKRDQVSKLVLHTRTTFSRFLRKKLEFHTNWVLKCWKYLAILRVCTYLDELHTLADIHATFLIHYLFAIKTWWERNRIPHTSLTRTWYAMILHPQCEDALQTLPTTL